MLLSELKEQVAELSRLAKKEGVDPEVQMATLPNFPVACSVNPKVLSSLTKDFPLEVVGGIHIIILGENKELGGVAGEITEGFGWR